MLALWRGRARKRSPDVLGEGRLGRAQLTRRLQTPTDLEIQVDCAGSRMLRPTRRWKQILLFSNVQTAPLRRRARPLAMSTILLSLLSARLCLSTNDMGSRLSPSDTSAIQLCHIY